MTKYGKEAAGGLCVVWLIHKRGWIRIRLRGHGLSDSFGRVESFDEHSSVSWKHTRLGDFPC
jgi:hypothetical protein